MPKNKHSNNQICIVNCQFFTIQTFLSQDKYYPLVIRKNICWNHIAGKLFIIAGHQQSPLLLPQTFGNKTSLQILIKFLKKGRCPYMLLPFRLSMIILCSKNSYPLAFISLQQRIFLCMGLIEQFHHFLLQ